MYLGKVEKILKGSLDSIPPPSLSVKIQIMGGKVCLRLIYRQNIAGHCQQTFENKKVVDINVLPNLLPQVNFPANNLNFH